MSIQDYLCREAARITAGAPRLRALLERSDSADSIVHYHRRQYLDMMGVADLPDAAGRGPVPIHITGVVERPAYRIEKLAYEALPKLYVTANLYLPARLTGRAPAVLYVCGHADDPKVHYQAHARRFAELGFVTLLAETIQLGEGHGYHHGTYREGWWHWISRGYSPAAVEMLCGIRGLDLLAQRPEVDGSRMGVTGISGGGAATWWIAAADERVKAAAPACGTATLGSHIAQRTIDGHCDCMWWPNTRGWDLADVGALIAPRPLLIASADRDPLFTVAGIRRVHGQLERFYDAHGAADNLRLVETPGGHGYHQRSRTAILSWFLQHLAGKVVPPEQVGDVDERPEHQETAETLRVYAAGPPPDDRTKRIQDEFIPLPPPELPNLAALESERARVVAELRRTTFRHFPAGPPRLDVRIEQESEDGGAHGARFAFTSEEGWRLHGSITTPAAAPHPAPLLVALRSPGEERGAAEAFAARVGGTSARVVVEPRGTGETAWGEELQWHVRRAAAWTGRTIASMQVWDTLRALEAARRLPAVDAANVSLAARGPMCAVALYAALLDGSVRRLYLDTPPATQNAPSQPDGRGPAIEMLGCLRVTDLPQVAGLLAPAELVLLGDVPATYAWPRDLYDRLGSADHFHTPAP